MIDVRRFLPLLSAALLVGACSSDFTKPGVTSMQSAEDLDRCTARQSWLYDDATEQDEHVVVTDAMEVNKACMRQLGFKVPVSYWGWWAPGPPVTPAAFSTISQGEQEPTVSTDKPKGDDQKTAALIGPYRVQLGAYKTQELAFERWSRLQNANSDLLGNLRLIVEKVDLGRERGGIFYRMQAGPLSSTKAATELCTRLTKRRVRCFPVRS